MLPHLRYAWTPTPPNEYYASRQRAADEGPRDTQTGATRLPILRYEPGERYQGRAAWDHHSPREDTGDAENNQHDC